MSTTFESFISGRWTQGIEPCAAPVVYPATGRLMGHASRVTPAQLDQALQSSLRGFAQWSGMTALERARIMRRAADLLRTRGDAIAAVLTAEEGKPLKEARGEVDFSADSMEWYADEGRRIYGKQVPARMAGVRQTVHREPVGPVAAFVAWNFPCLNVMRKISAALGAGCSIIVKPSEETPGTAIEAVKCLLEAGVPPDALNLVFGEAAEVSEHLLASPIPRKVTFTGSTAVGKHLQRLSAQTLKRCTLELGGHAPVLVFDDADLEQAVRQLGSMKIRNAGQVCIAPSRFFIQRGVYDDFVALLARRLSSTRVGDGADPTTEMGPLASARRLAACEAFTADAVERGATIACGGTRLEGPGFFFPPTVLKDAAPESRAMREEPFCPVVPCAPFDTLDEAIARANELPYGLASYAFTRSMVIAQQVQRRLDAGMVGINHTTVSTPETPLGGVNESGYGSEGGAEGLDGFLRTKFVTELPLA
jgi:succinate-semialdehyde dehydrogenase/glutarate-semialdehyde dehydrogenase